VTAAGLYSAGVAVVALGAAATAMVLPPADRPGLWLALGLTLVVQAPLGWWLVASVRAGRAVPAWVAGMAVRVFLVVLVGLVVLPATGWPAQPGLLSLVALLVAMLVLEGVVLWWEHFGAEGT
jgi:hypothetical protein